MTKLFVCFKIHQPHRLTNYSIFNIGKLHDYFIEQREIMEVLAKTCYIPGTKLMLDLLKKHKGKFKFALNINGSTIDLFEKYYPEIIENLKILVNTDLVEIVSGTYYNSLASLYSFEEFEKQIEKNNKKIEETFKIKPTIFMDTLYDYNHNLKNILIKHEFKYVIVNGEITNFNAHKDDELTLIPNNLEISNLIIKQFSNKNYKDFPITVEKFKKYISMEKYLNLVIDFEVLGEIHRAESGIFRFFEALPRYLEKNCKFISSQDFNKIKNESKLKEIKKDLKNVEFLSLIENKMQKEIFKDLSLLPYNELDEKIYSSIGKLQDISHLKNISLKNTNNTNKYSPYEQFIILKNILNDLKLRINCKQEIIQKI